MLTTVISSIVLSTYSSSPKAAPLSDLDGAIVNMIRVIDDKVYVVGMFERANRKLANNVAVWDGSQWSTLGKGVDGKVYDVCKVGTDIYVCGDFTYADKSSTQEGIVANRVARWDGTKWNALGARTVDREIFALATDGKSLYIGGNFTRINDETDTKGVAKYNGKKFESVGAQFDRAVMSMTFLDGKLYVGGIFEAFGDDAMSKVAVYDGRTWNEVGNGGLNGSVSRLTNDGKSIFAAGKFTINGKNGIAVFNGSKWGSAVETDGLTNDVNWTDGTLSFTGDFRRVNGKPSERAGILKGTTLLTLPEVMYAVHNSIVPYKGYYIVGGNYQNVQAQGIGGVLKWGGKHNLDDFDLLSK